MMDKEQLSRQVAILRELNIRRARESLWSYCCLLSPDFYKPERWHLWLLCECLQALYERRLTKKLFYDLCHAKCVPAWYGDTIDWDRLLEDLTYVNLMINMPPRHGKSRTLVNFCDWILGRSLNNKIISVSYNTDLASDMSRYVRDGIMMKRNLATDIVYSDIFPNTRIARGNSGFMKWALDGCYFNYLGAGLEGTITGKGANCLVGSTLIQTPYGPVKIEDICSNNSMPLCLSYDHINDKIVFRKILCTKRSVANEFITIQTNTGRKITCTREHRLFDGNGYREAKYFREGETVITVKKPEEPYLHPLWEAEERQRAYVPLLLHKNEVENGKVDLQAVRKNILQNQVSVRQSLETSLRRFLLLCGVQPGRPRRKEQSSLSGLWETYAPSKRDILFQEMFEDRRNRKKETLKDCLSHMWKRISAYKPSDDILFKRMCQQSTLPENGRPWKLPFQKWRQLQQTISGNEENHFGQRWSQVLHLRSEREIENLYVEKSGTPNNKSESTSYRREPIEQQTGESYNTLCSMPPACPQTIKETIVKLERYCVQGEPVYDIQVEGTSNFFANGLLVHNCSIIDDPVKNAEESYNDRVLEGIFNWYTGTFMSRSEKEGEGSIGIINHTRWNTKDLCGRILESRMGRKWMVLSLPVEHEGDMLCKTILPYEDFCDLRDNMDPNIFRANYYQEPVDIKGRLFTSIKTYEALPEHMEKFVAYVDTADTGEDYLICICGGQKEGEGFITDVYYTQAAMEVTEPETARRLVKNKVNHCKIESNNGGRGFARNVEQHIWNDFHSRDVHVDWFHQSENKMARILTGATFVMQHIYFPENWARLWPDFYLAIMSFQKAGGNKHDDAAEGLVEFGKMIRGDGSFQAYMDYMKKLKESRDKKQKGLA